VSFYALIINKKLKLHILIGTYIVNS
jgi:hypothetical protein